MANTSFDKKLAWGQIIIGLMILGALAVFDIAGFDVRSLWTAGIVLAAILILHGGGSLARIVSNNKKD